MKFPLLTSIVLLPAVVAVVVSLLPSSRHDAIKAVGFVGCIATAALCLDAVIEFDRGNDGLQFVSQHIWIKDFGISWLLGIDGISLFLVALTGLLFPIAIIGPKVHKDVKAYVAWLLVLESAVLGSFLALDLFLFFVFFEVVLVPMYFLIGGWGYDRRVYASVKFFIYTLTGSAFLLVGMLALVFLQAKNTGAPVTFNLVKIAESQAVTGNAALLIFAAFAIGFAVKVPLFPLHTWLPDAHTEAPTAGSIILAGVMLKLGTYGLVRFGLYLFPHASKQLAPALLTVATIGVIYGALVAVVQKDLKRLVAYSSIAHLGFIVLGTFAFTSQGLTGATLQMVNHGVSTSALFLLVGFLYERRHTRQISELRGVQKAAPVMAGIFTIVMFSSIGVPGLNGFLGEFLILIGSFATARWWTVVATAGVILAALYLLDAYQRVFHGEPDEANANIRDLDWRERAVLAPLLVAIVFLGVFPQPVLERITPSANRLLAHVKKFDEAESSNVALDRR